MIPQPTTGKATLLLALAILLSLTVSTPAAAQAPEELDHLALEATPNEQTGMPEEKITYTLEIDYAPTDWNGTLQTTVNGSALGLARSFTYEIPITGEMEPPVEKELTFTVPDRAPPVTYKADVLLQGGGQSAKDQVALNVNIVNESPGLAATTALLATIAAALFTLTRRRNE